MFNKHGSFFLSLMTPTTASLSLTQKALYAVLLVLIAMMIFFSLQASKNQGEAGYNRCVQEKCEQKGEEYCHKLRELSNCCLGAGGQLGQQEGNLICLFKSP